MIGKTSNFTWSRDLRQSVILVLTAVFLSGLLVTAIHAISATERDNIIKRTRALSKKKKRTFRQENLVIGFAYQSYYRQQKNKPVSTVGQPVFNNTFPVSNPSGNTGVLTFHYIDPGVALNVGDALAQPSPTPVPQPSPTPIVVRVMGTAEMTRSRGVAASAMTNAAPSTIQSTSTATTTQPPAVFQADTTGPTIGSVLYEINTDPDSPNTFTTLGISSDPSSNFALSVTLSGIEPVIRATPLDPSGAPIVISGVNGLNVAVGTLSTLPPSEPSTDIFVHTSSEWLYDSGGTQVLDCFGSGCTVDQELFTSGNTQGNVQWEVESWVVEDASQQHTTFSYTVSNDTISSGITVFQVANNGLQGVGSAPAGWTFSQDSSHWTWQATSPSAAIAPSLFLTSFNVTVTGAVSVSFDPASQGQLLGSDWMVPGTPSNLARAKPVKQPGPSRRWSTE